MRNSPQHVSRRSNLQICSRYDPVFLSPFCLSAVVLRASALKSSRHVSFLPQLFSALLSPFSARLQPLPVVSCAHSHCASTWGREVGAIAVLRLVGIKGGDRPMIASREMTVRAKLFSSEGSVIHFGCSFFFTLLNRVNM